MLVHSARGQARQIDWFDDAVDALGVNGSGLGGGIIAPLLMVQTVAA
jgi:hypothetical protein